MSQNNDRKNRNGPNRNGQNGGNNWRGLLSLVSWALLLTIVFSYAGAWVSGSDNKSSVEITYSEFISLIESDKIAKVEFEANTGLAHITPAEGFTYTDEDGKTYGPMTDDGSFQLYTKALNDDQLISRMLEHNVDFGSPYTAPISPILEMLISYILPFAIMMLLLSLVFRIMAKRGGGMGGIGGVGSVGKANAKVYMEKSTGVTFRDVAGQDEAKESLTEII